MRCLSSADPADTAAWRVVRAAVVAARPAVAAAVQLRAAAVAVAEWGAQPEAVEAADVPRLEAVEAPGASQDAEVGPRGALPREAADVPRLEAVEAPGAPQEAEVEAPGARVEAEEAEALGALPQPEVKLGLPGAWPMATLMVGPAAL